MRDSQEVNHAQLVAAWRDHLDAGRARNEVLEATALRNQSWSMRDIFAQNATDSRSNFASLREGLFAGDFDVVDYYSLAQLARVCALQDFTESDVNFSKVAFSVSLPRLNFSAETLRFYTLYVDLLIETGDLDSAKALIQDNSDLAQIYHGYLLADLLNPSLTGDVSLREQWLHSFNAPFRAHRLRSVRPRVSLDVHATAFDRLSSPELQGPRVETQPLVTVIVTTFKPSLVELELALASITAQSWWNLEIIIVDDASPEEYAPVLDAAGSLDERIQVHRLGVNKGTYVARNFGLEIARGKYVTGQDADDWSHPDRILTQVRYLQKHRYAAGVITDAMRMTEDLLRVWRGYRPDRPCEASLMLDTELARQLGGYLRVRKSGDSEFRARLEAYTRRAVHRITEPLYLTRLASGSLSRADFKGGWQHPSRRAFAHSYARWHRSVPLDGLSTRNPSLSNIFVPDRFRISTPAPREYDFVIAHDWRRSDAATRHLVAVATRLLEGDLRIGLLQMEDLSTLETSPRPTLAHEAQALIDDGAADLVEYSEPSNVQTLVIPLDSVLHFPPFHPSRINSNKISILTDRIFYSYEGTNISPNRKLIDLNALSVFGRYPDHASLDQTFHYGLPVETKHFAPSEAFPRLTLPELASRIGDRSDGTTGPRPILGLIVSPVESEELEELAQGLASLPKASEWDIRVLVQSRRELNAVKKRKIPKDWLLTTPFHVVPRAFLSSLDYFLTLSNSNTNGLAYLQACEAAGVGAEVLVVEI